MVWMERVLKDYPIPPFAMGWDTFHCPRLLQAPVSNLALDIAQDPAAAPAPLGILCQHMSVKA